MTISNDAKRQLKLGLELMQLSTQEDAVNKLLNYVDLLTKWNQAYNLTAVRTVDQIIPLHILDSLVLLPYLNIGSSVLDVGTGAGLPGIPLSIMRSDLSFLLLDSQQKKINFVQHVITSLQLANVKATQQRIEALQLSKPVDIVVSRAFASLGEFAKLVANVCNAHTRIIAMKARRELVLQEADALPEGFELESIETVQVPEITAERCLVFLKKRD